MGKQKLVIVLGMHRSGTSAVARGLQVLGVELGSNLLVQQSDNIKGFWEDSDFKILNQDMLRSLGREWHSVALLPVADLVDRLAAFRWRALGLLRTKMADFTCFGFKDPRTCLLMPFWKAVFLQANIEASYVIVVRHPLSVASSLQNRNGFGAEKSFYLWLEHALSSVTAVLDETAAVVDYDLLLERPGVELARIAQQLNLGKPAADALAVYEQHYLETDLRHSCYQAEDLVSAESVPPELISAYSLLRQLARDQLEWASPEVKGQFLTLQERLFQKSPLLAYVDQCEQHLAAASDQLLASEKMIQKQETSLQASVEAISARDNAINVRDERLDSLMEAIQVREDGLEKLKKALKARDGRLDSLAELIRQREAELKNVNVAVKQRDSKLIELKGQLKRLQLTGAEETRLFKEREQSLLHEQQQLIKQQNSLRSQNAAYLTQQQELQQASRDREQELLHRIEDLTAANQHMMQSPGWLLEQKARRLLEKKPSLPEPVPSPPEPVIAEELPPPDVVAEQESLQDPVELQLANDMELIRQSGLFAADTYRVRYPDVRKAGVDPLRHYLLNGAVEGRNPHPLFANAWYLKVNPDVAKANVNPLLHYVQFGAAEGRDPHPFFSAADYYARYPEVKHAGQNPLQHYLHSDLQTGYEPHALFDTRHYLVDHPELGNDKSAAYADCIQRFERSRPQQFSGLAADASLHLSFDWKQQQRFIEDVRRRQRLEQGALAVPLVSIIMATRDRRSQIGAAIDSILAQTWQHWELLIVDDGGEDDTLAFVQQHYADPRIHIQRIEASGVSHARNVGLLQAQGEWISYLDSDNQWVSCFLEIMLAYTTQQGADFAYSAIRLLQDEGIAYRYHDFVADDLLIKNYIDLNSIFHHRVLYEQWGAFDTGLARTVDWDLIIRYTRQARQVVYVPFVGADYDDRQNANRITVREFNAWRFVVTNKHAIDWLAVQQQTVKPGRVSIILAVLGSIAEVTRCLEALLAADQGDYHEIVLVDSGSNQEIIDLLAWVAASRANVRHVLYRGSQTLALAHNFGAAQTEAEYLVFLDPRVEVMQGWLPPLLAAMSRPGTGAVQPKILAADGSIQQIGMVFSAHSALGYPLYAGMRAYAPCVNQARAYQALGGQCLLVRRSDFLRLGGFHALYINELEAMDFCLQLTAEGHECWSVPASCVISHRVQKNTEHVPQNRKVFIQRWAARIKPDDLNYYEQDGFAVSGWVSDGLQPAEMALYQPLLQRNRALTGVTSGMKSAGLLIRDAAERPLFALKVPCPNAAEQQEWGDYHFACSLGAALRRQGYAFRIDLRDQWAARSQVAGNEVNLLLRGRGELPLRDDQLNLMWLISHPDRTSLDELQRYDHVFVASAVYTAYLQEALGAAGRERVSCLLQCTDPGVFYPGVKEAAVAHALLFVGNSRNQYRDSVRLAIEAGLAPAVYGTRWPQFIPPALIQGENIPNAELGRYYRSAGVVLNDHWPDMREKGFVSNRIFDGLACGAALVSDDVQGLPAELRAGLEVFVGNNVETFRPAVDLAQREPVALRQQRFQRALYIHEKHSFDARVTAMLAMVEPLFK